MTSRPVIELTVGDVILPPERELRLWMRRRCAERGLPETVLRITIAEAYDGTPDKRGPWRIIRGYLPDAWYGNGNRSAFDFKARPATPWQVVQS